MPSEIIVEFPSPLTEKEKKMIYGYNGEVVRCKDCRWFRVDGRFRSCMMGTIMHPTSDDYCSFGERKEDE